METRPQHRRLVAGTRPATTLSPVAYITTDFIGCAIIRMAKAILEETDEPRRAQTSPTSPDEPKRAPTRLTSPDEPQTSPDYP